MATRSWLVWFGVLAGGCAPEEEPGAAVDLLKAATVLSALRPGPLLELLDAPGAFLPGDALCPELLGGVDGARQAWAGGCEMEDGRAYEGRLDRQAGADLSWVAGEGFLLRGSTGPIFALDGAIELLAQGELLLLDVAATLCGGPASPCDDAPEALDLAFSLFPVRGYPEAYSLSLSGVVGGADGPVQVDGTWRVDQGRCQGEPVEGALSLRGADRLLVTFDGEEACDECAQGAVLGLSTPPLCGLDL